MSDTGLRERIQEALGSVSAEYIEVRVEESQGSHIRYRGKELEEIGRNSNLGGNVRALAGGGWGFACFNDISDLKSKVRMAVEQAKLVTTERVELALVDPVVQIVPPVLGKDPRTVPLSEKKDVLDHYVETILSTPEVRSSTVQYGDGHRRIVFANSDGAYIEQERIDVTVRLAAMARNNGDVQQSSVSLGSLGDFGFVERLEDEAREVAQKSVALLNAPEVKGGPYTVILDPILAGVFIHEAFGHLSEADHVYNDPKMREIMVLGRRFGGEHLNVVDGASVPELRGSYQYDEEGVPAHRTDLIREGVLVGRLHSRETAAKMGETPTGNARAISYRFPPIVRMTNTFIEPGQAPAEDLFTGVKEGVYARNWYGGMTSMEMFTFSAGEAYMVRDGKVQELLRPVMLTGNLFTTLENLDAVANDLDMNQGGGCGKNGQSPLPVSNGSPHIRIQNCLVGGA